MQEFELENSLATRPTMNFLSKYFIVVKIKININRQDSEERASLCVCVAHFYRCHRYMATARYNI